MILPLSIKENKMSYIVISMFNYKLFLRYPIFITALMFIALSRFKLCFNNMHLDIGLSPLPNN